MKRSHADSRRMPLQVKRVQADRATRLECQEYVDVPGLATKDVKLHFYTYTEGTTQVSRFE